MNCTKIEKLLPLHIEGDLSEREGAIVRAHLSSCDRCRGLSEEFRASQERLHNFAVPDFGAEFYEQLRGAVLAEINSRPLKRPSVSQTLRTLFMGRPAMAVSLALLVLLGAVSFAAYRSFSKRDAALMAIENGMGEFTPAPLPEAAVQDVKDDSMNRRDGTAQAIVPDGNPARKKFRREVRTGTQPAGLIPERANDAPTVAQTDASDAPVAESAAPAQAIARMEIQTSDPNIRIIWLGRKASE